MPRTIRLTNGNDKFTQGLKSSTVSVKVVGLGGNDTINMNRADDLGGRFTVLAGGGNDVVQSFKEDGSLIKLGGGNDTYIGRGFGSFGTELGDVVLGQGGKDTFAFETFKSTYDGGKGNDIFHSVGWQNTIRGGAGSDTVSYAPRADDFSQGSTGVTIDLEAQRVGTGSSRVEFLESIENATGSDNGDIIFGTASSNVIEGGGGLDDITGGFGADRFVYRNASDAPVGPQAEVIRDFSRSEGDKIDLSLMDAKSGRGNQQFDFIGIEAFSQAKGELRSVFVTTNTRLVQGDINGDGIADFQFIVISTNPLLESDFIL